jgi:hypothetical protein
MGSEWDYTWAVFAHDRMEKRGVLDNASMLRGDVFYFLRDAVKSNTVDAFHMYFPDPWPKERHHKNRLLRPDFLTEVARVLKPGGSFAVFLEAADPDAARIWTDALPAMHVRTVEELSSLLAAAGFAPPAVHRKSAAVTAWTCLVAQKPARA